MAVIGRAWDRAWDCRELAPPTTRGRRESLEADTDDDAGADVMSDVDIDGLILVVVAADRGTADAAAVCNSGGCASVSCRRLPPANAKMGAGALSSSVCPKTCGPLEGVKLSPNDESLAE